MNVILRAYQAEDLNDVVELFRGTVHNINSKDYTPEQINAWAPAIIDAQLWGEKLLKHYTVVAEIDGVLCGFGDIDDIGYFDHLFVHKDYQGRGIAKEIVKAIEAYAPTLACEEIRVHVSITAKPLFMKSGYVVINPQEVEYNGQKFTNYVMKKQVAGIK